MKQEFKTLYFSFLAGLGIKKDFDKIIRSNFADRHVDYLSKCEPLYAVSRLYGTIKDPKTLEKFKEMNLRWIEKIVRSGKCKELTPCYARYGADLTCDAILYAIKHDMWKTPDYKTNLDHKDPSNYDGCEVIHEIIPIIRGEEETQVIPAQESKIVEQEVEPTPEPVVEQTEQTEMEQVKEPQQQEVIMQIPSADDIEVLSELISHDHARGCTEIVYDEMKRFLDAIPLFMDVVRFFKQESQESKFVDEIDELHRAIQARDKQNEDLQSELQEVGNKYAGIQEELAITKHNLDNKTSQHVATTKRVKKLQEQVEELKKELETLKKVQETPAKKTYIIIPASELSAQPMMGKKTMGIVKAFLRHYNVMVDDNK